MLRVRMQDDECTISLVPCEKPLHRRGYRVQSGAAPLREDLARALVLASGWQPDEALLDPFAGTGQHPDRGRAHVAAPRAGAQPQLCLRSPRAR
jgi:putative N6-adenine-specific DNA methylase